MNDTRTLDARSNDMLASELDAWLARMAPPHTPEDRVDGIMAGDPAAEVTGIAVTWLPSTAVLESAAKLGLNFVLAHEPVYYHHPFFYPYGDSRQVPALDLQDKMATPAGRYKQQLIVDHNLVVHRLHDGWDQFPECGMGYALASALGWSDCQMSPDYIYAPPPATLKETAAYIASRLGKSGIRYTGDPEQQVRKISLDWGSPGAIDIAARALEHGCDAALTGEVVEWRDLEFARDSGLAFITGGHCATETPGMQACCGWLKTRLPDMRIEYIDTVDPDHFA